jgi:DNA-binding MarR family transcriptional regulator
VFVALAAAGMDDLRGPHMAVFQYPGPHGTSPLELARRAKMSKQAMNQLLGTLQRSGYIVRKRDPDNGKQRVIHLTARGNRAIALMREEITRIERRAERQLGARRYATMIECLRELADGGHTLDD